MRLQAKCTWGVALVVLAFAVALSALAGCGGKAEENEATGGDVFGFIEFLVPVIELSKCTNLSAAAQEFETNTGGNLDFRKEAKEFQRFVDAGPRRDPGRPPDVRRRILEVGGGSGTSRSAEGRRSREPDSGNPEEATGHLDQGRPAGAEAGDAQHRRLDGRELRVGG
jgi:hypothetical protein